MTPVCADPGLGSCGAVSRFRSSLHLRCAPGALGPPQSEYLWEHAVLPALGATTPQLARSGTLACPVPQPRIALAAHMTDTLRLLRLAGHRLGSLRLWTIIWYFLCLRADACTRSIPSGMRDGEGDAASTPPAASCSGFRNSACTCRASPKCRRGLGRGRVCHAFELAETGFLAFTSMLMLQIYLRSFSESVFTKVGKNLVLCRNGLPSRVSVY